MQSTKSWVVRYFQKHETVKFSLLLRFVLRFLKICKSLDYYKFVEAMMIVERRLVILRTPDENAKICIVRSSQDIVGEM